MAVVLAAILLTTIGLSAVWYITLRNQQIDARLDYLISEAQDIAYLASNYNDSSDIWNYFPVYGSTTAIIRANTAFRHLPSFPYAENLYPTPRTV